MRNPANTARSRSVYLSSSLVKQNWCEIPVFQDLSIPILHSLFEMDLSIRALLSVQGGFSFHLLITLVHKQPAPQHPHQGIEPES